MKKIIASIIMLLCFSVFAEEYTVVAYKGKVKSGKGEAVSIGQTLRDTTRIKIKNSRDYVELNDNRIIQGPCDDIVKNLIKEKKKH